MKSPAKALKNAYESTLQALTVGGQQTHFYKALKKVTNPRYMYISGYTATDVSDKDGFMTEVTLSVTCVAPYDGSNGQVDEADDIADQVIQAVVVKAGNYMNVVGFFIITLTLDDSGMSRPDEQQNETASIRTLRFRHIIGES